MAHTYYKRGASTSSAAVAGAKTNGGAESATSKDEDYSPNHVVYKKVWRLHLLITMTPVVRLSLR